MSAATKVVANVKRQATRKERGIVAKKRRGKRARSITARQSRPGRRSAACDPVRSKPGRLHVALERRDRLARSVEALSARVSWWTGTMVRAPRIGENARSASPESTWVACMTRAGGGRMGMRRIISKARRGRPESLAVVGRSPRSRRSARGTRTLAGEALGHPRRVDPVAGAHVLDRDRRHAQPALLERLRRGQLGTSKRSWGCTRRRPRGTNSRRVLLSTRSREPSDRWS